jgi:hypothetical protein
MFTAYLVVTVLAIVALTFSATADFVRYHQVLTNMAKAGVPESWLTKLAILKAAGAAGLLVGFVVPPVGVAAAVGVILFFIGAIITHVRARWYSFSFPSVYLLLALGSLVLGSASATQ